MRQLLAALGGLLLLPAYARGAAIAHTFVEQATAQTTTSTSYADISGTSIADTEFVDGAKYWLYATAQITNNTGSSTACIGMVHGTTMFTDADGDVLDHCWESATASLYMTWQFSIVWTAVASEGVKLQFKAITSGTVTADNITVFGMRLDADLTENTDWFFNQDETDAGLSATFNTGGTVTFTPGTAGHNWLVITTAVHDPTAVNSSTISRIGRSGEASSSLPSARMENTDATNQKNTFSIARVFSLGAASNTLQEESGASASAHNVLYSNIFVLNLNKFDARSVPYTEGTLNCTAVDYADAVQSGTIQPSVASDVLVGAYFGFDKNAAANEVEFRLQVDGADDPVDQTTHNYQFSGIKEDNDITDINIGAVLTSLSAASHTLDIEASVDTTTTTPQYRERSIWAFTMELATAPTCVAGLNLTLLGVGGCP